MFGFININKPKGMTSHDVVARLRRASKIKQIGHTGTLDPMAEGVLPIAVGKATRLIEFLQEDKAYIAELEFGKISDTYDTEGVVEKFSDVLVTKEMLLEAAESFNGVIKQVPPAYSAVHYKGKRLYELARSGIIPDDIPVRTVEITQLELLEFNEEKQLAKLLIACSKGTYIRSIVNDLGMKLGSGAVMTALQRTKSGTFVIEDSIDLEKITDREDFQKSLINPLEVLNCAVYELSQQEYEKVKHGQGVRTNDFTNDETVLLTLKSQLCAIAKKDDNTGMLTSKKVFIQ